MSHDDWDFCFHDDVARRSAEDHLAQPALRVGALDQEIGPGFLRLVEIRLTRRARLGNDVTPRHRNAVSRQGMREILGARSWGHAAFDADHLDVLRLQKKRHGKGGGARRFTAAVPRHDDGAADRVAVAERRHQHRPTAFEQRVLERRLGEGGELRRLLDHDEVEDAAKGADNGILPPLLLAPFGGRPDFAGAGDADRHVLRGHELAKDAARLLATLLPLALKGAVDFRRDREPHLAAEDDGVFGGDCVQADDMAVETPRHAECGGDHRTRIAIGDDCQNRFHRQSPVRLCRSLSRRLSRHTIIARLGVRPKDRTCEGIGGAEGRAQEKGEAKAPPFGLPTNGPAQAPGCGSGSRPPAAGLSRPDGGTEDRRPGGRAASSPLPVSRTIGWPCMMRRISSADSVSYSSNPLATECSSSRWLVRISRAPRSPWSMIRRISWSMIAAVASETFLRCVTE